MDGSKSLFRSFCVIPSKDETEQESMDFMSAGSVRKKLKTSVSRGLAGDWPAEKRRACWKKPLAMVLGTEVFCSSEFSLVRRLCFGLEPMESGTHWPGAMGPIGHSG